MHSYILSVPIPKYANTQYTTNITNKPNQTRSRLPHDPLNLPPKLRHSTLHLPRQHIPKTRKRLSLPLEILISALY